MNKIKKYIIEALGGTTKPDYDENIYWRGYYEGRHDSLVDVINNMNSLYGDPSWGERVYEYAKSQYDYWKKYVEDIANRIKL